LSFSVRNINVSNLKEAQQEITKVGSDSAGCRWMAPKAVHRVLKVSGLEPKQANIIKQEMLSRGGEAAVARGTVDGSIDKTDVLLMGTLKQFNELNVKLKMQPFGLSKLAEELKAVLGNLEGRRPYALDCRGKSINIGERTIVMGILNATPDSFSDGGTHFDIEDAVAGARRMVAEGADIIDLGGESTRPGHIPVGLDEELRRIMPVLERLIKEIDVPISIDTFKAEVAKRAMELGAHIINDQWALRADSEMAAVAARYGAPVIIMHNQKGTEYSDLMGDIVNYFRESIKTARNAGIPQEKIIIDPGIGFGKTVEQNLEVMRRLPELSCLGQPVLLGTSRKSMIGKTLNLPVNERIEGTGASVAVGITLGVDIIRVHDVKEMVRVARMTDAMVRTSQ
jgi:dihydropteroate synthase